MLRRWSLIALFLFAPALWSALLPDKIGGAERSGVQSISLPDAALAEEFGFDAGEKASYGALRVSAWRTHDSTGALAVAQWLGGLYTPEEIVQHGNYVFRLEGAKPPEAEWKALLSALPKLEESPLPALTGFLPEKGLVPGSRRYILGTVSLERFFPGVPPSMAAFHLGAEGQAGVFRQGNAEQRLLILNYPTPVMARERVQVLSGLPGAVVKRAGPLVALVLNPRSADEAERLLSSVRYQAQITWSETVPQDPGNVGDMILAIFTLAGMLLLFCLLAGLAYAGYRLLRRRLRGKDAEDGDSMIVLHIDR